VAKALTIFIPFDEVRSRPGILKKRDIFWVAVPAEGCCIHTDIYYIAPWVKNPGLETKGFHSANGIIGDVYLANYQRVLVVWTARPLSNSLERTIRRLRTMPLANHHEKTLPPANGMFTYGKEAYPGWSDGSEIGTVIDLTRGILL
jgi:hypothetical protein